MDAAQMPLTVLTSGQIIRLAEEKDAEAVVAYIRQEREPWTQFIDAVACGEDYLDEATICHNLYECNEEFLLLEDNGGIRAMIRFGISVVSLPRTAQVNAILMQEPDTALLLQMFDAAARFLPAFSIVEPTVLLAALENRDDDALLWWQQAFAASGFAAADAPEANGMEPKSRDDRLLLVRPLTTT